MSPTWIAALAALAVALVAGVADRRQGKRRNLDRVGLTPWPLVMVLALLAAAVLAALGLRG